MKRKWIITARSYIAVRIDNHVMLDRITGIRHCSLVYKKSIFFNTISIEQGISGNELFCQLLKIRVMKKDTDRLFAVYISMQFFGHLWHYLALMFVMFRDNKL